MDVDLKSDWMLPRIEVIKNLYGMKYGGYDEEVGGFFFKDKSNERLLMVMSDPDGVTGNVNSSNANNIMSLIEENGYKDVYIIADSQTKTAFESLKDKDVITMITSNSRIQLTEKEILEAFYTEVKKHCLEICETDGLDKENCKAAKKRAEPCQVRTLIDNAEFHANMKWKEQLLNDFTLLDQLEAEQ